MEVADQRNTTSDPISATKHPVKRQAITHPESNRNTVATNNAIIRQAANNALTVERIIACRM